MTYVVALGGFAHIVAGSVECAFLVQSGRASLAQYVMDFFTPTLLGNILGGTTLVALLNYGQVASEINRRGNEKDRSLDGHGPGPRSRRRHQLSRCPRAPTRVRPSLSRTASSSIA